MAIGCSHTIKRRRLPASTAILSCLAHSKSARIKSRPVRSTATIIPIATMKLSFLLPLAGIFTGAMAEASAGLEARAAPVDLQSFIQQLSAKVKETAAELR